jgi:nucleotide-binding universal stress UspA family protein
VAVGGPYANRLLDLVGELARGLGATVVVFHMRERPFTGSEWILGEGGLVEGVDEATRVIDLVIARLRSAGVRARGSIRGGRVGQVGREILEVAAAEGADLIVLGCHRRSVLDELLGGSVARRVRRGSAVPVLVVPRHRRGDSG